MCFLFHWQTRQVKVMLCHQLLEARNISFIWNFLQVFFWQMIFVHIQIFFFCFCWGIVYIALWQRKNIFTVESKQDPSVTNVIAIESDFTDKPLFKTFLRSTLITTSKIGLNGILPISSLSVDDSTLLHSYFLTIFSPWGEGRKYKKLKHKLN